MSEILSASVPGGPGRLTEVALKNRNLVERTSYKLFGYDFVNYRSDCEQSNVHGLIKYHDVVNYGRRMSDANIHNCVMCGEFDVVIPTQNKDVCKSCDSSFWYNSVLNCAFKFCKGCKNFVTIEMFSDKPDASKCCRCRRRGRDNYLNKKYNVTPQHGTLLLNAFQNEAYQGSATVSPSGTHSPSDPLLPCSDEDECTASAATLAHTTSFHTIPYSTNSTESCGSYSSGLESLGQAANATLNTIAPPSAMKGPYKKRALSVDYSAPATNSNPQAFYGEAPVKPPKTPRSVSYSSDVHSSSTPSASSSSSSSSLHSAGIMNTPSGRNLFTVTPGSELSLSSVESGSANSNKRIVVRFARSDSLTSVDRERTPSSSAGIQHHHPQHQHQQDHSGYLWDRSSFQGSPMVPEPSVSARPRASAAPAVKAATTAPASNCATAITRQNSDSAHITQVSAYTDRLSSSGASYYGAKAVSTVRFADLVAVGQSMDPYQKPQKAGDFDKENQRNLVVDRLAQPQDSVDAMEMMSILRSSCRGLFGGEGTKVDTVDVAAPARESVAVVTPTMQGPAPSIDVCSPPTPHQTENGGVWPHSHGHQQDHYLHWDDQQARTLSNITGAPARQQWEWDPSQNPLMHLAMITEHI